MLDPSESFRRLQRQASDGRSTRVKSRMMTKFKTFRGLYAIIDSAVHRDYGLDRLLANVVLESDIPVVQLRLKILSLNDKLKLIQKAAALKKQRDFFLIINDDLELLVQDGVDGLHLGQEDIDVAMARKSFPQKVIGLSTHSLEQAQKSLSQKASYIGCGPIYPSTSKPLKEAVGLALLKEVSAQVTVPVVAIGGIKLETIAEVASSGCSMAAVISDLVRDGDFFGQRLHEEFLASSLAPLGL